MDMRALLEKMMKFAGGADQKQGPAGQLRGGAKMPKKGGKHPAHHKLVGDSVEPEDNMLGELAQEAKDKSIEWRVAEAWKQFKEEAFKDTAERRPARKGSRPSRGHEPVPRYKKVGEATKEQETEFHTKLDKLVHDTFGKRKDEMEESAEGLNVGDDVIITGPVEHKGETGVIDSFGRDKRFVIVNLYNHGKKSFHSSDVSYNDYAGSDEEEAEMYDRDPEFRDWAARQEVDEGWGAEPAAARHREQMTAVARVLQKYKNDPVKSKIANYLFVNNWAAPAIEKELADPNVQQKFQTNIDKYERQVGPVKDWSDKMSADYLQSGQSGVDESQGDPHKILLNKLRDIERKSSVPSQDDDAVRSAQAKADYAKYVAKMKKKDPNFTPLYKMDEYGANQPTGTAAPGQEANDPQQAAKVAQAAQTLKAATGTAAPAPNLVKAIDAASQGTSVPSTDAKVLEPLMKDVATVAQDPKLAGQFKSLLQQVDQAQRQKAVK